MQYPLDTATELTVDDMATRPAAHTRTALRGRLRSAVVGLPAGVAFALGTIGSFAMGARPLDPDVQTYEAIARQLSWDSIFGGSREPLWPVLFYIPVHLLGDNVWIAIRGIGVAGFVFMVIAFQALVTNLFGRGWAIVAGLVVAASPFMVFQSTRGLREQTSAGLVLLLCIGLVQPRLTSRQFFALFALTAVTGLLRADVMDVMLGALVLSLVVRRPPLVIWLAGPAIVVALIGPEYIADYIKTGDPFYHTNVLARFFRNVEFAGQPGFITANQMKVDAFGGAPVTWTWYVFGMHSPVELIKRAVTAMIVVPTELTAYVLFFETRALPGPIVMMRNAVAPTVLSLAWIAGAIGGMGLLRTRAWVVPVMIAGQILMYSTIAQYMDYRLVLDLFPLLVICVIFGVLSVAKWSKPRSTASGLES